MNEDQRRYRDMMAGLRQPNPGQGLEEELPEDPDTEHVPVELRALDGEQVTVTGIDRDTGELVEERGVVTPVPGLHGDLHRREQTGR